MCLPDCRLQVRPTSQRCVQVSMKGCVSVVKGERENSGESPEGRSASSSCDKAPTQQLDPAVDPSSNIYPRTLRGGISFTLPVPSSLFVSLYSFSLSIQTSYLFSLPFPTLLCPICDPVSPLHFPLFPSGAVTCGSEQVRAEHLPVWGCSGLPGVMRTRCLVGPSQTRPRLNQFDDARKRWV